MISYDSNYGKLKLCRILILSLFSLVSLIPFNYLQFITLGIWNWQIPFYYLALGIPVFLLTLWTFSDVKIFWKSGLILTFTILYAGMFMSLIQAVDIQWAIRSIASFSLRGPFVAIAIVGLHRAIKDMESAVRFMSLIVVLVACIGIEEFISNKNFLYHTLFTAYNPYYPQVLTITWRGGICSSIGHPLPLSAFLVLSLPMLLTRLILMITAIKRRISLFLSFCALLIVCLCIYLSFSRSSWVSASICVILLLSGKRHIVISQKFKAMMLGIFGLVIFTFLFIHIYLPQARTLFHNRSSLGMWQSEIFHSHRTASYSTVFNIIKSYPLWGVGFGNYPKIHKKFVAEGASPEIETPDNQYLRWLADTGIVGFGCLVAFFVLFFRKFIKAYRKCPDEDLRTMMWAMFCGIIGFMVNLMAFDGFFWMAPNFAFWMMIGLLAAAINLAEKKADAIKEVAD